MTNRIAKFKRTAVQMIARASTVKNPLMLGIAAISLLAVSVTIAHFDRGNSTVMAPVVLSESQAEKDRLMAQGVFAAQEAGDYAQADQLMAELKDRVLIGHMLAQRYLASDYHATPAELASWLQIYDDHPQAARIRSLANRKGVSAHALVGVEQAREALKGDGYIDHLGRSSMPQGWYTALRLWKERSYGPAEQQFAAVGENTALSHWTRAAGYYWAYRSADALKDRKTARAHLEAAATFPTTFYGLLAARQQGGLPKLMVAAPYVSKTVRHDPHALRAAALVKVNRNQDAEDELRLLTLQLPKSERAAVLTLASELGLANLQVRLAGMKGLTSEETLFGNYPMPQWVVGTQTVVNPALLLAIARQESVFREEVKSFAGAVGMMQMLPSTARFVERSMPQATLAAATTDIPLSKQLTDPQVSLKLGAEYLRQLTAQPYIGANLIKVAAAYNAGPGSVQNWQSIARSVTDPLLYIESIPYAETRNYVMQVMAHTWVYESLMGQEPKGLTELADGHWPTV